MDRARTPKGASFPFFECNCCGEILIVVWGEEDVPCPHLAHVTNPGGESPAQSQKGTDLHIPDAHKESEDHAFDRPPAQQFFRDPRFRALGPPPTRQGTAPGGYPPHMPMYVGPNVGLANDMSMSMRSAPTQGSHPTLADLQMGPPAATLPSAPSGTMAVGPQTALTPPFPGFLPSPSFECNVRNEHIP